MGAQSWFPSNNYPTDKATFDTIITVPSAKTALGVGELVRRTDNGDGTTTWHWREDDPTATYLTTATVGDFIYTRGVDGRDVDGAHAAGLQRHRQHGHAGPAGRDQRLARAGPAQLNFLSDLYGPYPFDSTGAVADRAAGVGYALEVQTKPHYSGGFTSGNPSINIGTQLHELAHQWVGNSVTLETWSDIWFNEGWANWSEWYWQFHENGGPDPAAIFDELYADTPDEDWEIAPAVLDGDPANLFVVLPDLRAGRDDGAGLPGDRRRRRVLRVRPGDPASSSPTATSRPPSSSTSRWTAPGCTAPARPARRLLPAVALRRDEADDPPDDFA